MYFTFKFGLQGAIIDYKRDKRVKINYYHYPKVRFTFIKLYLIRAKDSPSSAAAI